MERCPNCRARFKGEPVCYRCGCDLAPLLEIEARAQALERLAVQCLGEGDRKRAEQAVEQAMHLHRRPLTLALQGFVHYLDRQAAVKPTQVQKPLPWWRRLFGRHRGVAQK